MPWVVWAALALLALLIFRRQILPFVRLLGRTAAGLAGLLAFSLVGPTLGVSLGVNLLNALVLGLLGLPGFALLLLLNWAL